MYIGDFAGTETVMIPFNAFSSNDPSASITVTDLANTDVVIFKDGSLTQRSSAAGVAVDIDVDTNVGMHWITIDLSDNTDAGFYAAGSQFAVGVVGMTVDAGTVTAWVGSFTIGKMAAALATYDGPTKAEMDTAHGLLATEAKQDIIDTNVDQIEAAVITNAAGADVAADIIAMKADTAAILVDTGTTLDAALAVVDGNVDSILTDTGTTLQAELDAIQAAVITNAAGVDIAADIIAVKAETAAIVNDTDLIDDGTSGLAKIATDVAAVLVDTSTTLNNLVDNLESRLGVPSDLGSGATIKDNLIDVSAFIDTEVAAILALLDDARTEPGQGAPPVNPDLATKIDYLYKAMRNKKTQTATEWALFDDAGSTVDQKSAVSDAAGTATFGEIGTGP